MISWSDYAALRPYWVLAIPLVIAMALYLRSRSGLGDWRAAVDPGLMKAMERRGLVVGDEKKKRPSLVIIALALLALALVGPAVRRPLGDSYRNLDGIIVAFDLSRSVAEGGNLPSARLAAMEVLQSAGTRQVALMVYSGDAYMAANFTADRAALGPLIAAFEPDLLVETGSDVGAALKLAGDRFKASGIIGGDVVLVTDGGGILEKARTETARLAASGYHVNILFVDNPDLPAGAPKPDTGAAMQLASLSGGVFADISEPALLSAALADGANARIGQADYIVLNWIDYGRWLLIAAAVPVILMFRRRS